MKMMSKPRPRNHPDFCLEDPAATQSSWRHRPSCRRPLEAVQAAAVEVVLPLFRAMVDAAEASTLRLHQQARCPLGPRGYCDNRWSGCQGHQDLFAEMTPRKHIDIRSWSVSACSLRPGRWYCRPSLPHARC